MKRSYTPMFTAKHFKINENLPEDFVLVIDELKDSVPSQPPFSIAEVTDVQETISSVPEGFINLGDNLLCGASTYMGRVNVHIRRFKDSSGSLYPTKEGITLSPSMWNSCRHKLLTFKHTVVHESTVVDGKIFMCVVANENNEPLVNIQYIFNMPPQLSRTNILLTRHQFENLIEYIDVVSKTVNKLVVNENFRFHVLNSLSNNMFGAKDLEFTLIDVEEALKGITKDLFSAELADNCNIDIDECNNNLSKLNKRQTSLLNIKDYLLMFRGICDECMEYKQNPLKHDCPFANKTFEYFDRFLRAVDIDKIGNMFMREVMYMKRDIVLDYVKNLALSDVFFFLIVTGDVY